MHRASFHIFFLVVLLFLALPSAVIQAKEPVARDPDWATPLQIQGAKNFFEILPGVLYRSEQPNAEAFRAYEAMGIRTVINLRSRDSDTRAAKDTRLLLRRVPINTWDIRQRDVVKALSLIREAEKPVLVHCYHGADRTGVIIAAYRIVEQGWSKEKALDELRNGGYGFHSIWRNIPAYIQEMPVERIRAEVDRLTPTNRDKD